MYRILIVDDEPEIAEGIYHYLMENMPFEMDIYRCYSAVEAIEWLGRSRIDIILSDIKMPGLSGLQLIEEINSRWPECRVIFISGYNEFDFVQKAINQKAVGFVLKTQGYPEIIKAIERAIQDIRKELNMQNLLKDARDKLLYSIPLLQREYLLDILDKEENCRQEDLAVLKELDINLDTALMTYISAGHIENGRTSMDFREYSRLSFAFNELAKKIFQNVKYFQMMYDRHKILWLIQFNNAAPENPAVYINGCLEMMQAACWDLGDISLSIVIDPVPFMWSELSQKIDLIKYYLTDSVNIPGTTVIIDKHYQVVENGDVSEKIWDSSTGFNRELKKLEAYLESRQEEEFRLLLKHMTDHIRTVDSMDFSPAVERYYLISILILTHINRHRLIERIEFRTGAGKLTRLHLHSSWMDAIDYLFEVTNIIFQARMDEEQSNLDASIDMIKNYILDHLSEDLSLVRLSELVHFTPSYVSRAFKQVTGQNLLEYIMQCRLDKAKELLLNPNIKINEIATEVGYYSAPYFTRFFRKALGMSPKDYREASLIQ